MDIYRHTVQYYETDKMGITHHSNYVRWMEEARVDFLKQIGWDYAKLESLGIISPVVEVNCKYKKSTVFAEDIFIKVSVSEFKGVKLYIRYDMTNDKGDTVCVGDSVHCFMNESGRPVKLAKEYPEFDAILKQLAEQ